MMSLESFAEQFQSETGCSDKEAVEAAFVMAAILADIAGEKEIGDHFITRANESFNQ